MFKITTTSIDEATVIRALGFPVAVSKKACSVKAIFEFDDTPEIRQLLEDYKQCKRLPVSARKILTTRADLYREARAARGGL